LGQLSCSKFRRECFWIYCGKQLPNGRFNLRWVTALPGGYELGFNDFFDLGSFGFSANSTTIEEAGRLIQP
jgi:hypothetical protein